jgi:hypothetical protein
MVQYNVYCVEGEQPGEEIAVCITICNIFGLKDQLLGNKPMPNGDYFYWPARMLYSHQVATTMEAAGNILPESASFLKTANGRPLIVLSRLSKVKPDSIFSFQEIDEFLPTFIQGRTPRKVFELNVISRTTVELGQLLIHYIGHNRWVSEELLFRSCRIVAKKQWQGR